MAAYGGAFVAALVTVLLVTPALSRGARFLRFMDKPGGRHLHDRPTPTAGGVGIYLGVLTGALLFVRDTPGLGRLLAGGALVLLVGLLDDRFGLSPRQKFAGQLVAAGVTVALGTRIEFLTHPLGGVIYLGYASIPLTLFWILAVTNMMNFIDGLDGLAAGVASIAAFTLAVVAFQLGRPGPAALALLLAGASLGFLWFNWVPARIFMGDTGSLFLGFFLAGISVEGALKGPAALALSVPLLALGVPAVDLVCAVIRRLLRGVPLSQSDQDHLHHRLLALGLSPRQAVLALYGASLLFAAVARWSSGLPPGDATLLLGTAVSVSLAGAVKLGAIGRLPAARAVPVRGESRGPA